MDYIYFLMDGSTIVYIGRTINLQSRIATHSKSKVFTSVKYIECKYFFADGLETFLISYFRPKYNFRVDWKNLEIKDFNGYKEKELV